MRYSIQNALLTRSTTSLKELNFCICVAGLVPAPIQAVKVAARAATFFYAFKTILYIMNTIEVENMDKKVVVRADHLIKSYGEGEALFYALNDVSMEVYDGELLVILGGSGSGKSTLLNMLGGMDKVESGTIIVNGKDITKMNNNQLTIYRRDDVGFVYQFFNLINDVTVFQNVTLAPKSGRNKERAMKLLKAVGLEGKENKFPRQMSGGQQQRVAIARALNKDSNILFCDEPTGALDDASGKAVLALLDEIHKNGKTIVLVTHTREIASMADRVITMKDGKIVGEEINEHPVSAAEVKW